MSNNDARTKAKREIIARLFAEHLLFTSEIATFEQGYDIGYDIGHAAALERPELGEAREIVERLRDEAPEFLPPALMTDLRQLLDAVPQQWVETGERLPDSSVEVLCQLRESGRLVCNSWAAACDQNEAWFVDRFIAWMPLPSAYQKRTVPETVEQFMEREGLGEKEMIDDTLNDRI